MVECFELNLSLKMLSKTLQWDLQRHTPRAETNIQKTIGKVINSKKF